jgi:hypothetical protein
MNSDIENFAQSLIDQSMGPLAVSAELLDLYGIETNDALTLYRRLKGLKGSRGKKEEALAKYEDGHAATVYKLLILGRPFDDISDHFKVDSYTLNTWRFDVEPFAAAWEKALHRDFEVAETLLKLALGFEIEDTKVFLHQGEPVLVPYMKQIPPNLKAVETWLKAKYPAIWKETQYIETNSTHALAGVSTEELEDKLKAYGVQVSPSALSALTVVDSE